MVIRDSMHIIFTSSSTVDGWWLIPRQNTFMIGCKPSPISVDALSTVPFVRIDVTRCFMTIWYLGQLKLMPRFASCTAYLLLALFNRRPSDCYGLSIFTFEAAPKLSRWVCSNARVSSVCRLNRASNSTHDNCRIIGSIRCSCCGASPTISGPRYCRTIWVIEV